MIDEGLIKTEIDQQTFTHIHGLRKWTMFLSVAGFVFIGLLILLFIGMTTLFERQEGASGTGLAMMVPMLVMLAIYFFPIYFLFQFSRLSKKAIVDNDSAIMSEAFKFLKFHYRFMGIMFIIVISIYIILGIIMAATGALSDLIPL